MQWLNVRGVRVPPFLYGTAWKEEQTTAAVTRALAAGFRGFDTANQRKHYVETGVGDALRVAFTAGLARGDVFLQTKFTYARGQDHRLPYDPRATFTEQVRSSFESSLEHLEVSHLDSYLLHGPAGSDGLSPDDFEVWAAMEARHAAGQVSLLGVSNVSAAQLAGLVEAAKVPPAFVQNRCYANRDWDQGVRSVCEQHGIVYQGFSLLTANRDLWKHERVVEIARRLSRTPAQILFRFALQLGILPLTGSTDARHLASDLAVFDFALSADDVAAIRDAVPRSA